MQTLLPGFPIFAGVFDGHRGSEAAVYAADHLFLEISARWRPIAESDRTEAALHDILCESFLEVDRQYLSLAARRDSGTTALVCLVAADVLVLANAGDCRAVLARRTDGGGVVGRALNQEHRPCSPAELARIVRAGGSVGIDGSVIGNGNASAAAANGLASAHGEADELAVSRAIGDANYKRDPSRPLAEQVVTALPDVYIEKLCDDDWFIILATDGLGDVMSPQDSVRLCAAKLVEFDGSPMLASKAIIHQAALHMEQGGRTSTDNITVVVIVLRDSKR